LSEKRQSRWKSIKYHLKEDGVRREEKAFGGMYKAYCVNIKPKLKEMKPTKANSLNNI
jgi:hypothetical protein